VNKGDVNDIFSRLKKLLPAGWFGDETPKLDTLLLACATSLSWGYSLYQYARLQTRISTASNNWLDIAARDFFGVRLRRAEGESDDVFRLKISNSLFRERGTRQAISTVVKELTGLTPTIIEPQRSADTGGYGCPAAGYGMAGRYGSQSIPCQAFVIAYRAVNSEAKQDNEQHEHEVLQRRPVHAELNSKSPDAVKDAHLYAAIAAVKMEGTIVWVRVN